MADSRAVMVLEVLLDKLALPGQNLALSLSEYCSELLLLALVLVHLGDKQTTANNASRDNQRQSQRQQPVVASFSEERGVVAKGTQIEQSRPWSTAANTTGNTTHVARIALHLGRRIIHR